MIDAAADVAAALDLALVHHDHARTGLRCTDGSVRAGESPANDQHIGFQSDRFSVVHGHISYLVPGG